MKVCILAAGEGTRNKYAKGSNKALLPLGDGTALSYIMGKFPDAEIVIAVGYSSELIKAYVKKWARVTCVDVDDTSRGPGWSLLCCRDFLRCPFIFTACDTIVFNDIPEPDYNWMGVSHFMGDRTPYLTAEVLGGMVTKVYDKGDKNATHNASIGLVGVNDYKAFWEGLASPTIVQGEHQDTSGLNALIPLEAKYFTWLDTGTTEGYEYASRKFNHLISERTQ